MPCNASEKNGRRVRKKKNISFETAIARLENCALPLKTEARADKSLEMFERRRRACQTLQ